MLTESLKAGAKIKFIKLLFFSCILISTLSSCKVASFLKPNILLNSPANYVYPKLNDSIIKLDYRIAPADLLNISISPNNGFNRVNFIAENNAQIGKDYIEAIVGNDGLVKLPLVGYVNVNGKSVRELETLIEELYENYYVKPFVVVTINNRRIVVLQGTGTSRSLILKDNNTTLYEALGEAGGIREDGKSYSIKLIRKVNGVSTVFKIDLSNIKNVENGNITLLANDVIYVEPRLRLFQRTLNEITPILSILSTSLLIYNLFKQ